MGAPERFPDNTCGRDDLWDLENWFAGSPMQVLLDTEGIDAYDQVSLIPLIICFANTGCLMGNREATSLTALACKGSFLALSQSTLAAD